MESFAILLHSSPLSPSNHQQVQIQKIFKSFGKFDLTTRLGSTTVPLILYYALASQTKIVESE